MLRIVLIVIALASGSAAAWLTTLRAPTIVAAPPSAQPAMEEVLVAAAEVPRGHRLAKEHLKWQPWPQNSLGSGFITKSARPDALDKAVGVAVRNRIIPNEPIVDAKLGGDPAGVLARILPAGHVAVAVRVTAETMAGGFILPADRVDVLHTAEESKVGDNKKRHMSRAILRNVTVLAIDQAYEVAADDPSKVKPTIGKTATLALTLEQAEVLAAAEATGSLSLALRSARDNDVAIEAPTSRTVRIIRAGQVETIRMPTHVGANSSALTFSAKEF